MAQNKNNKPGSGLYVAVFFVFVILIVIMFFVKKDDIVSNLKKTEFFERVGVATPEFVEKHQIKQEKKAPDDIEIDLIDDDSSEKAGGNGNNAGAEAEKSFESGKNSGNGENSAGKTGAAAEAAEEIKTPGKTEMAESGKVSAGGTENSGNSEKAKNSGSAEKNSVAQKNSVAGGNSGNGETPAVSTRTTTLYFVSIGADGSVSRCAVKRQLARSDSPLTDAVKALLGGPLPGEKNAMSLIPSGSKLIGASVKNGVATLNFNENFEFNSYGVEGSIGQLMQIVYTATEFSTVKSVQFLIEGEKKEYLGSEGQWIGTPLSRGSF